MHVQQLLARVHGVVKENKKLKKENEAVRHKIAVWTKMLTKNVRSMKHLAVRMRADRIRLHQPKAKKK